MSTTADQQAEQGVVYVATQQEKYLVEAKASALSLKDFCPDIPICVFTDLLESTLAQEDCFDSVLPVAADTSCGTEWGRGLRTRMLSLPQSPYEKTFHLDTDTRFMSGAIAELFAILDEYEIGMIEDPPDVSIGVRNYGRRMLDAGVMLFRKSPNVLRMFEHWQRLFLTQLETYSQDPMPTIDYMAGIQDETVRRKMLLNDQFALAQLLSPKTNAYGLRLKILDEAWNFCGTFAGKSLNRPMHVDHGLHLKADVFTRKDHNPKPESLSQLTGNIITSMARAQVELKHGSPEASLSILDEAIGSIPNQSLVLVPIAREMIRLGRLSDAQHFAEQAILSDPNCYPAFVELAHALLNQGDLDAAAKCVQRCRSRFPGELGILGVAQVIHGQCGAVDPAIAKPDYDKFLAATSVDISQALKQQLQDFILQQQRRRRRINRINHWTFRSGSSC
jgi:tetratricopeptide (TPR) repeat protein